MSLTSRLAMIALAPRDRRFQRRKSGAMKSTGPIGLRAPTNGPYRGDTEENCRIYGRQAGVTGETAIILADMPVTPCLLLCHPLELGFPFVSPLSPLSHLGELPPR